LGRGIDIFSLSIREVITFVEGWWLDFFEPSQWNEVMGVLVNANASSQTSLFAADGTAVPVNQSLIDQMNALTQEAMSTNPSDSEQSLAED